MCSLSTLCLLLSVIFTSLPLLWYHSCSHSPKMPSDHRMRDWTFESSSVFLCLVLVTVAAVAPAAEAGVSTSCATPSFLFPYHCSMAALSGRQPFHCSCAPITYRRHDTHPTQLKRLAPNRCDTWHLGALSRFCLQPSVSSLFLD